MPSQFLVESAIKYANKIKRIQLAGRLGEVAAAKAQEEQEKIAKKYREESDQIG